MRDEGTCCECDRAMNANRVAESVTLIACLAGACAVYLLTIGGCL